MLPGTLTSGENRAMQDLGSQYGSADPHCGQSLARLQSAPLGCVELRYRPHNATLQLTFAECG